jgi:hypothetical protein
MNDATRYYSLTQAEFAPWFSTPSGDPCTVNHYELVFPEQPTFTVVNGIRIDLE